MTSTYLAPILSVKYAGGKESQLKKAIQTYLVVLIAYP